MAEKNVFDSIMSGLNEALEDSAGSKQILKRDKVTIEPVKVHKAEKIKRMGSTELIANLFRISQTEEKLRKDNIKGADKATQTHYAVGSEVRKAIEKIGGTLPEDLPTPEKSIQQIEKEQMELLQKKAKAGKLMLDE